MKKCVVQLDSVKLWSINIRNEEKGFLSEKGLTTSSQQMEDKKGQRRDFCPKYKMELFREKSFTSCLRFVVALWSCSPSSWRLKGPEGKSGKANLQWRKTLWRCLHIYSHEKQNASQTRVHIYQQWHKGWHMED